IGVTIREEKARRRTFQRVDVRQSLCAGNRRIDLGKVFVREIHGNVFRRAVVISAALFISIPSPAGLTFQIPDDNHYYLSSAAQGQRTGLRRRARGITHNHHTPDDRRADRRGREAPAAAEGSPRRVSGGPTPCGEKTLPARAPAAQGP